MSKPHNYTRAQRKVRDERKAKFEAWKKQTYSVLADLSVRDWINAEELIVPGYGIVRLDRQHLQVYKNALEHFENRITFAQYCRWYNAKSTELNKMIVDLRRAAKNMEKEFDKGKKQVEKKIVEQAKQIGRDLVALSDADRDTLLNGQWIDEVEVKTPDLSNFDENGCWKGFTPKKGDKVQVSDDAKIWITGQYQQRGYGAIYQWCVLRDDVLAVGLYRYIKPVKS